MLKEWGNGQAPAREAAKAGDMKTGIPLFVNAIGGPGALTVVPMPTRG
jgi:non-heme chloroperoxidase